MHKISLNLLVNSHVITKKKINKIKYFQSLNVSQYNIISRHFNHIKIKTNARKETSSKIKIRYVWNNMGKSIDKNIILSF